MATSSKQTGTAGNDANLRIDDDFDELDGLAGNDILYGDERSNTLNGGAGNDILLGLGGNDDLYGGDDNDTLVGGAGGDDLYGGDGNDVLVGSDDGDRDHLFGQAGNDILVGGNYDWFYGGYGADILVGFGRHTTAFYGGSREGVTVNLTTGKASGGQADGDILIGITRVSGSKLANDTLTGDHQNNFLRGREGDDILEGRGGADDLWGESGNDTASYAHSPGGVAVDLTLTDPQPRQPSTKNDGTSNHDAAGDELVGIENLEGSEHADTLTGNGEANWLTGRGGNDTLTGGGGSDVLEGGAGADLLRGGGGLEDRAAYTESPGGVTVDLRLTGAQRTTHADETSNHDAAGDTLVGIEALEGSDHADELIGNGEKNYLVGHRGDDTLRGGGGNDEVEGELGQDTLWGGTGADTFIFDAADVSPVAAPDVVKDFSGLGADGVKQESEDGDKLDVSGLTEDMEEGATLRFIETTAFSGAGAGTPSVGEVRYAQDDQAGTDTDVTHVTADLDGDGDADFQVTLEGLHTLTGADVILA